MVKAMTEKDEWIQKQEFSDRGVELTPWHGLNVEHQNSTRHEYVKFALTRALYEVGEEWDSEVEFPNGREADVVSLGPEDGKPVVYEVETDVTPQRKTEKLNHFYYPFEDLIRDVIIISPGEVPADIHAAVEHLLANEVLGEP